MLLDGGESALSIRAIADAVGVSPPSIYLHFSDRNELVFAVCERHFEALHACFLEAIEGVVDPVARIRCMGEAYIRFGLENPEPYRIMFMARPDTVPEYFTAEKLEAASGFGLVIAAVQAAIDAGRFGLDDAVLGATVLWACVHGVTSLLIAKPGFPWPERKALIGAALDACERGLIESSEKSA
jgi:AcrR family transcriptional regulator